MRTTRPNLSCPPAQQAEKVELIRRLQARFADIELIDEKFLRRAKAYGRP